MSLTACNLASEPHTLTDKTRVVRGKNAGPTQLTIDVFLRDGDAYGAQRLDGRTLH